MINKTIADKLNVISSSKQIRSLMRLKKAKSVPSKLDQIRHVMSTLAGGNSLVETEHALYAPVSKRGLEQLLDINVSDWMKNGMWLNEYHKNGDVNLTASRRVINRLCEVTHFRFVFPNDQDFKVVFENLNKVSENLKIASITNEQVRENPASYLDVGFYYNMNKNQREVVTYDERHLPYGNHFDDLSEESPYSYQAKVIGILK